FALLGVTIMAAARSSARMSRADVEEDPPGRQIFEQRCAVCHTTGERAAQGPGLGGIVGRPAASTHFGYSRALREASLTWDRGTLDRFLSAPALLVPGTSMPMAIPDDVERRAVLDYLATLAAGEGTTRAVGT